MRDYTQFAHFEVHDFLEDDSFREWVYGLEAQPAEQQTFWDGFITALPERRKEVETARNILIALQTRSKQYQLKAGELDRRMANFRQQAAHRPREPVRLRPMWYGIAAAIALLVGLAAWALYSSSPATVIYETAYGETRELRLPDGTTVFLNANSRLMIPADAVSEWQRDEREVTLDGEAYFMVVAGAVGQQFTVYTPNRTATVEVLGTKFNLDTRFGEVDIALQEGRIHLQVPGAEATLQPGERFVYKKADNTLVKRDVVVEEEIAWTRGVIKFSQEPLRRVVRELRAITGADIQIADDSLGDIQLSLSVKTTDIDEFFDILQTVEGARLRISKTSSAYVISRAGSTG